MRFLCHMSSISFYSLFHHIAFIYFSMKLLTINYIILQHAFNTKYLIIISDIYEILF